MKFKKLKSRKWYKYIATMGNHVRGRWNKGHPKGSKRATKRRRYFDAAKQYR